MTAKKQDVMEILDRIREAWNIDIVIPVRCSKCKHYKEVDTYSGKQKACVIDADLDKNTGVYYGFYQYRDPDWYCADGEFEDEHSIQE